MQILKDHGLDPKTQSQANKLQYEIPPLGLGKQLKPKTPVTQIFREALDAAASSGQQREDPRQQWEGKLTVQKPFEF